MKLKRGCLKIMDPLLDMDDKSGWRCYFHTYTGLHLLMNDLTDALCGVIDKEGRVLYWREVFTCIEITGEELGWRGRYPVVGRR